MTRVLARLAAALATAAETLARRLWPAQPAPPAPALPDTTYIVEYVGMDVCGQPFRCFTGPFESRERACRDALEDENAVVCACNAPRPRVLA